MEHQEFNVVSKDGTYLTGRLWKPSSFPRGAVCLVHGLGEHSGRYNECAANFCRLGLIVYAVDLRGHGLSEGPRGHVGHLSEYLDDINCMVRRCKRSWGAIPQFLYGHSMGGTLALNFLLRRRQDFDGAVITSPWLSLINPPSSIVQWGAKILDNLLPALTLNSGIRSSQLTSEEEGQSIHQNDNLVHKRISIRLYNQLNDAARYALAHANDFYLPLFFAHGSSDTLTSHEATSDYSASIGEQSRFFLLESARHEVHREPGADHLFSEIMAWAEQIIRMHNDAK